MSVNPRLWGPYGWSFIHYIALGYPDKPSIDIKYRYRNFFISLGDVLPCNTCRKHYKEMISMYPPAMNNMEDLFRWTVDIHNKVNSRLGKPILSYPQALEGLTPTMSYEKNNQMLVLVVSIVVIMILFFIWFIAR